MNSNENKLIKSLEQKIKNEQDKLAKLESGVKLTPTSDLIKTISNQYDLLRQQGKILGLMEALVEALKLL